MKMEIKMKDFAKSIKTGNAGDVIHRDGDFKIKYNEKENSYELYFNSIYYDTFHTKQQALDKIELYKKRKEARTGNSKVGNGVWYGEAWNGDKFCYYKDKDDNTAEVSKKVDKNGNASWIVTFRSGKSSGYGRFIGEYSDFKKAKNVAEDKVHAAKTGNSKVGNAITIVAQVGTWKIYYDEKEKEYYTDYKGSIMDNPGFKSKQEVIDYIAKKQKTGNSKVGNAEVVKDGSVWVVLYAEGTKSKEFDSEAEAKKFAAQVGNRKVGNSFESAKSEYEKAVREIESELKSAKPNIDKYFQIKERIGRTLSSERNNIQKELSAKINELINMESNIGHLEDKFYK